MDIRREFDDWQKSEIREEPETGGHSAFTFLCLVVLLTALGLIMLYSASYNEALSHNLVHHYFFTRQLIFVILALAVGIVIRFIPISWISKSAYLLIMVSIILLLMTLFTPFGQERLGSRRWLQIGPLPSLQPSEFAKIAMIIFVASHHKKDRIGQSFLQRFGMQIVISLLITVLIFLQKDYSSALLFFILCLALLLASGFRLTYLMVLIGFLLPPMLIAMLSQPYRVRRIFSFLFPALDPAGMSYQVSTSLRSIRSGGLFGVGLGKGTFKLGLLPEVQSDFIFASICEEVGFVGSAFILVLFVLFSSLGYNAAKRIAQTDRFLSLCAFGLTSMVLFQAVLNLMVVTGLLPPTGIPLPFFSQGGTNLFIVLVGCSLIYRVLLISSGKIAMKKPKEDEMPLPRRQR